MNNDTSAPEAEKNRGLSARLIYLLPLITALGAGVWAVVTWLFPHPIPEKKKPEGAPAAASRPAAGVTATGGSMVIAGPVTGSSIRNGPPDAERRP